MDYVGPALGAGLFVLMMSRVPEPTRRTLNALIVAGASGVYISGGGFGVWELLCPLVAMPMAYRGLTSYRAIGLAWLVHSAWDLPHHLWGNPIWPFMPASSLGCFVFDAIIAVWFFALSRDRSRYVTGPSDAPTFREHVTLSHHAKRWAAHFSGRPGATR